MKVLFGIRHDGADSYFRAIAPASVLRYEGIEAEARGIALADADEFDVLILQRHCSAAAELAMRAFQDRGRPVIYDVDDWLFGIPPSWPPYGDYFERGALAPKDTLLFHERLLRRADMVTCTCAALADRLRPYNERVRVLPNCVMWADWDAALPAQKRVDGPVIGWFGMPYYWDTWRQIAEPVEEAVLELKGWLSILGYPEVVQAFSPRLRARTLVQPLCPWSEFAAMRRLIGTFGVGLAWQADTPFNRCKSPLKALQYGAAGVPVVASPYPYGEVLGEVYPEQFGLVAATPGALYHRILTAVRQPESARQRADAWRLQVFARHTYETQWPRWAEVIEEVLCDR